VYQSQLFLVTFSLELIRELKGPLEIQERLVEPSLVEVGTSPHPVDLVHLV
jgi:hypothetical protein